MERGASDGATTKNLLSEEGTGADTKGTPPAGGGKGRAMTAGSSADADGDGDSAPPARRPARRANRFSNSLRGNRKTGLAGTQGRLSVSFSDPKGLGAAVIGEILSDFDDADEKPRPEKKEGGEKKVRMCLGRALSSMSLDTIASQRSSQRSMDSELDAGDLSLGGDAG